MNETPVASECEYRVDLTGLSPYDWCNSLFRRVARENACEACAEKCENKENKYREKDP